MRLMVRGLIMSCNPDDGRVGGFDHRMYDIFTKPSRLDARAFMCMQAMQGDLSPVWSHPYGRVTIFECVIRGSSSFSCLT